MSTFQLLHESAIVSSSSNPVDPDKRTHIMGDVARLSDGRIMARTKRFDAAGNTLFSYGPWDADRQQAIVSPAPDPVAVLDKIADAIERKYGLHVLPHYPQPGAAERFMLDYPGLGAEILEKLKLTPPKPPVFRFDPGQTHYPKAGLADAREWFYQHVTTCYGEYGQSDPTPLSLEEQWTLNLLSIARQSDHAVQTGRGIIRSRFADIECVSVLSPSRRTTLIYRVGV